MAALSVMHLRTLRGVLWRCAIASLAIVVGPIVAAADVDPRLVDRATAEIRGGEVDAGFAMLEEAIQSPGISPAEQVDLLAALARLRQENGDFAEAGEAFEFQAESTARIEGASAPELAGLFAAAADAYLKAGKPAAALGLARRAFDIDAAYHDCVAPLIGRGHALLADILAALGNDAESAVERALADDPNERCKSVDPADSRGVVVGEEFAATTPASFARVKIFYATDRLPSGSDRPNDYFGGERGELQYGTAEVTVPRIHKPGEVESPSLIKLEWSENPERHFVITRIETLGGDEMFADMRATLAAQHSDEAFIFVHGFNLTFADAAKRTAQIAYDLNFTGAPVLYSWPSAANTFAYVRDEAVVRLSGRRLLSFLNDFVAKSGARHINLIAHSMGNRAVLDALELMAARRSGAGENTAVFNEIIFAAPDEDAALFAEMLGTIRPIATRLTLYGSDSDLALEVSKRLHGDLRRAGQGGAGILVSDAIDSVDMTAVGDDMLKHGYFAGSASALTDISWMFWRNTPPARRCGMEAEDVEKGTAWIFDPFRCDGPVMLSALTLLKTEGGSALTKIEKILSAIAGDEGSIADEWEAIRNAVAAAQP